MRFSRRLQTFFSACLLIILTACSQSEVKKELTSDIPDNPQSNIVYKLPDATFDQYRNVVFTPLKTDNVTIIPPTDVNIRQRDWELNPNDVEMMQRLFAGSVNDEITKGGLFTNNPDQRENTLIIETELLTLFPSAPKDDFKSRPARSKYITDGAGSMTVMLTAIDAQSGTIIARFMDTYVDRGRTLNNRITNQTALRQAFHRWAYKVREGLAGLSDQ